jgi:hypothetical protein
MEDHPVPHLRSPGRGLRASPDCSGRDGANSARDRCVYLCMCVFLCACAPGLSGVLKGCRLELPV